MIRLFAAISCALVWAATPVCAQLIPDPAHARDPDFRPQNGYWSAGEPRLFVSTKSELGVPYVKPYFSAGFGWPHWIWTGVDVNAIVTTEVVEVYSGLRLASPVLDLAFGIRDNWSTNKPFLVPRESFRRDQVVYAPGPAARYVALEGEAVGVLPLPHAALAVDFVMVDVLNMPEDRYLYEESYRLITKNSLFFVARGLALVRTLAENSLVFGVMAELGFNTGRDSAVLRVGPVVMAQLTDHLSLNMGFTLKAVSPDHLGLTLGAYGVAGFRYTWATGERAPKFPWQGDIIPLGQAH
jgi:hypothetical protein